MYNVHTAWNWSYLFRTYFMLCAYSRELTNNIFVEATLGNFNMAKKNCGSWKIGSFFLTFNKIKKIATKINLKCYYLCLLIMTSIIQMIFAQCKIYSNFSNYDFLILVAEFRIFAGLRIFFIPLKNRNIIRFQKS